MIFDPLGLIMPFTIRAKTLLQLMLVGCDWDEPVSGALKLKAIRWFAELPSLPDIKVLQCLCERNNKATSSILRRFADASEQAYGAVH